MMTTGTSDSSAGTVEVKENGHRHSAGDSENGANKPNESSNTQTTPKEDKHEAAEEMEIAVETRPPVENGRSSSSESAPAPPPPVAEPSHPSPPLQPSAVASTGGGTAAPSVRKRSGEPTDDGSAKRARVNPSERATALTPDISCLRTVELIESSLHKLKREVKAIDLLARQKEKEWDNLLKLRKAKEETFQRLRRKREVLLMQQSDEAATLAQRVASGPASGGAAPAAAPAPSPTSSAASQMQQHLQQHKLQQAQQQAHRAAAAAAALSGLRPIRPSYVAGGGGGGGGRLGQGMGPQGPTISVQHLIERHAADFRRRPELAVPLPASSAPAAQQDPQYREMLAQIAKLSKTPSAAAAAVASVAGGTGEVTIHQVSGPSADAGASQPQSSLAKLLMESKMKKVEPSVVSEMLKRRPTGPLSGGMLHSSLSQSAPRAPAPRVSAPPPPPPPPATEEVPLCQGCQQRQAQFVCAGCGHQWYCSRDCQVEAWDSHADDCSG